jgi:ParB family chromosome partitioning protein
MTAYVRVPVAQLRPNRANIRLDLGDLTELAASLSEVGVLQPLVIAPPSNGTSVVVDGHRRLAAAIEAGLSAVPCIITEVDGPEQTLTMMLAAAMHKQLEPMEQAEAFSSLLALGLSQAQVARRTGYSETTVRMRLALLGLPAEAKELVRRKRITLSDAQALATGRPVVSDRHRPTSNWSTRHRLARDAAARCNPQHALTQVVYAGACGVCWEQSIRADERGEDITARDEIDELAVQRAVGGDRSVRLNVSEREEAVRILSQQGLSDSDVAARLGVTARTVLRCRQRYGVGTSAFTLGRRPA